MTTVYATEGGHRFHETATCRDMLGGQLMNDGFKVFWLARNAYRRLHDAKPMTIVTAMGRGKEPCATCYPELRAALYRGNSEDDFGHEMFEYDGVEICARCYINVTRPSFDAFANPVKRVVRRPVPWPCTSAIVLGLVAREAS